MKKIVAVAFSYAENSMNMRGLTLMDELLFFDGQYDMNDFNMPLCNSNKSDGNVPEGVNKFIKVMRDADILVFAIPEATGHYAAAFKNAMDWLICESKFNSDIAVDGAFYNKPVWVVTFTPVIPAVTPGESYEIGAGGRHFEMTRHLLNEKMGGAVHQEMFVFNDGWQYCRPGNVDWVRDACNEILRAIDFDPGERAPSYSMKDRPVKWLKRYEEWDASWKE